MARWAHGPGRARRSRSGHGSRRAPLGETERPVAEPGDAAALKVGHVVLAVGHGPRASWGLVSALGGAWRTWRGARWTASFASTVLYPGFSGGRWSTRPAPSPGS